MLTANNHSSPCDADSDDQLVTLRWGHEWKGCLDWSSVPGTSGLKNMSYQPDIYRPCWWLCGLVSPDLVKAQKPFLVAVTSPQLLLALKVPVRLCNGFHLPLSLAYGCSRGYRSPCPLNGGLHDSTLALDSAAC